MAGYTASRFVMLLGSALHADAINSRAAEVADWLHSEIDIPGSPIEKNQELRDMLFRTIKDVSKEGYSKYYMPLVVSIGPIHRGRHHVQSMDDFKRKAVRKLAERVKDEVSVEQVYASVEQDLLRARDLNYNDRAWCLMMFLDGCFIIEFICNDRSWLNMKKHDRDLVLRDLLLYANQLPFEVLQVLARAFRYDVGEEEQAAAAAEEDDDLALCSPFSVTELKKEDVKELRARGILQINFLNGDDQAVINFFRHITAHYEPNPQACRYAKRQISTYLKSKNLPLRVAYAEFKQRYFSGPWNFLVLLAVIFTVSMTIIQTVLTGIQTYKKD
ncbi:hypothetical protein RND71_010856 [Anisodus tanguticus]|uniref:Uncharacterized protein n=1 Tax=Anisodus tanguticus TaxID=243964 RepID=A0AAE1VP67_9SOLA|nr:hypothetical protein RND71_010856 [Anisodus tanguticus]